MDLCTYKFWLVYCVFELEATGPTGPSILLQNHALFCSLFIPQLLLYFLQNYFTAGINSFCFDIPHKIIHFIAWRKFHWLLELLADLNQRVILLLFRSEVREITIFQDSFSWSRYFENSFFKFWCFNYSLVAGLIFFRWLI